MTTVCILLYANGRFPLSFVYRVSLPFLLFLFLPSLPWEYEKDDDILTGRKEKREKREKKK